MSGRLERTDVWEQVFPLRSGGRLDVDQDVGRVEVTSWDRDEAHVRGTKRAGRGAITADFDPRLDGRYKFDSASGRIEVTLPAGSSAELDLRTNAGRADCDFPLLNRHAERGLLRGVLGRSSCRIICRSGLGDIMVRPGLAPANRASDEDIAKILRMVEEKRLTPEAADELLRALEEEEPQ
ncbi:MAG: SHOCT-like domain-containing protein [Bacillota bacterium]